MQKLFIALLTAILLSGCAEFPGVYKIDVPQGNIVTQEMVDQLRPGMTINQVRYVLGTPLLTDPFNKYRWDYIYHNKQADGIIIEDRLTLEFDKQTGTLKGLSGDFRPGAGNTEQEAAQ